MLNSKEMQHHSEAAASSAGSLEGLQSMLFFESPAEIYARVFRHPQPC